MRPSYGIHKTLMDQLTEDDMTTFTLKDYIDNMYSKTPTELSKALDNVEVNIDPIKNVTCSITSPASMNLEGAIGSSNLTHTTGANGGIDYDQKVKDAPYHPGYEDAVITPTPKYAGMDPAKMLWKPRPLTDAEIIELCKKHGLDFNLMGIHYFAREIEERHGIK